MKISKLWWLGLLALIFAGPHLLGQKKSRAALEREKAENLKKLEEASRMLEETKNQKKSTVGQLNAIKNQIRSREKLITSISEEVALLEEEINDKQRSIAQLQLKIQKLKDEYAQMVRSAYKVSSGHHKITYLFASESVSQFAMRVKYFQQYSQARKNQISEIEQAKSQVEAEQQLLKQRLREKNDLIGVKTQEYERLNEEKEQQKGLVHELSKKEEELKRELEDRKRAIKKLERLIRDMIASVAAKANKSSSSTTQKSQKSNIKTNEIVLTPEARQLANLFHDNKGKLPWPVAKGSLLYPFGKQPHPVVKGVEWNNLGIDIQTVKEEPVRAVFQGKVISVGEVPNMNTVVIIQHGDYFTVYAKLKSVSVKNGDEVKTKQTIGEVYTNKDDISELQFQVWKNTVNMDPETWLVNR